MTQAFTAPNFTEYGFGIVRGPEELTQTLIDEVVGAYERGEARKEHSILAIEGPEQCSFVDRPDLTKRVSVPNSVASQATCAQLCVVT